MNIQQIIILIAGAIFFTLSFFIPEKKKDEKQSRDAEEKLIQEILDKEMLSFRARMDDELQDSIDHGKEVTERYMDRITNEKMTAVSEYSDTVMEQIHKNHEEAVFLYDMLNNKHAQVKNTAAELNNTVKSVRQVSSLVQSSPIPQAPSAPVLEQEQEKQPKFEPIAPMQVMVTDEMVPDGRMQNAGAGTKQTSGQSAKAVGQENQAATKQASGRTTKSATKQTTGQTAKTAGKTTRKSTSASAKKGGIEISFGTDATAVNSNDRILALHKEGKSNMAIARELGLGIGEVKLVIDLFEGI